MASTRDATPQTSPKKVVVETVFTQIQADFGSVDVLINNAGIIRDGLLVKGKNGIVEKKMSLQQWQSVIDVNLTGVFLCGREAAVKMIENQSAGVIINISSISKAGNMGSVQLYLGEIRSNRYGGHLGKGTRAPWNTRCCHRTGFMATDILNDMKPQALEKISQSIPLRRLGEPQEIANTALFIVENDYLSGRTIEIDGGLRPLGPPATQPCCRALKPP